MRGSHREGVCAFMSCQRRACYFVSLNILDYVMHIPVVVREFLIWGTYCSESRGFYDNYTFCLYDLRYVASVFYNDLCEPYPRVLLEGRTFFARRGLIQLLRGVNYCKERRERRRPSFCPDCKPGDNLTEICKM